MDSKFTPKVIEDIFTYHAPSPEQQINYEQIRSGARDFALIIVANTPASADQTAAIRKLREVVMTSNAAVATEGKY